MNTDFKRFSKRIGSNGWASRLYSLHNERVETRWMDSLYEEADTLEELTIYELNNKEPDRALVHLANEIHVRVKITQKEIFKIGGLLTQAKKICQQQKQNFKKWIDKNFDFSYETANNFMNVYRFCFAHKELALKLPASILYKISTPSFPDELREYLFVKGNLTKLTNGKYKDMVTKYEQGGLEAIDEDVERVYEKMCFNKQTYYMFDYFISAIRELEALREKIEKKRGLPDINEQTQSYEPEAAEIVKLLFKNLEETISKMNSAMNEAQKILNTFNKRVQV